MGRGKEKTINQPVPLKYETEEDKDVFISSVADGTTHCIIEHHLILSTLIKKMKLSTIQSYPDAEIEEILNNHHFPKAIKNIRHIELFSFLQQRVLDELSEQNVITHYTKTHTNFLQIDVVKSTIPNEKQSTIQNYLNILPVCEFNRKVSTTIKIWNPDLQKGHVSFSLFKNTLKIKENNETTSNFAVSFEPREVLLTKRNRLISVNVEITIEYSDLNPPNHEQVNLIVMETTTKTNNVKTIQFIPIEFLITLESTNEVEKHKANFKKKPLPEQQSSQYMRKRGKEKGSGLLSAPLTSPSESSAAVRAFAPDANNAVQRLTSKQGELSNISTISKEMSISNIIQPSRASKERFLKNLKIFLPGYLVQEIENNDKFTKSERNNFKIFNSVIVFLDISGFTKLNETLSKLGPGGAELVSIHINNYFTRLVKAVNDCGGDVLKFAGDALICMFYIPPKKALPPPPDPQPIAENPQEERKEQQEAEVKEEMVEVIVEEVLVDEKAIERERLKEIVEKGVQCGIKIQNDRELCKYKKGELELELHIGIGVGETCALIVGDNTNDSWEFLVNGEPLEQQRTCVAASKSGEVAVSPEVWEYIKSEYYGYPVSIWDMLTAVKTLLNQMEEAQKATEEQQEKIKEDTDVEVEVDEQEQKLLELIEKNRITKLEKKIEQLEKALTRFYEQSEQYTCDWIVLKKINGPVDANQQDENPTNRAKMLIDYLLEKLRENKERRVADVFMMHIENVENKQQGEEGRKEGKVVKRQEPAMRRREKAKAEIKEENKEKEEEYELKLRKFIPKTLQLYIDSGIGCTSGWIEDLRIVTILFIKIVSPINQVFVGQGEGDNEKKEKWWQEYYLKLNNIFLLMQKEIINNQGMIRQFLSDDKGTQLIAGYGLSPDKYINQDDSTLKAVKSALTIVKKLKKLYNIESRIGITTGSVFCGAVGSTLRREFAMVGDTVNLAARLMSYDGNPSIFCDESTYRITVTKVVYEKYNEEGIELKGKSIKQRVYVPIEDIQSFNLSISQEVDTKKELGRRREMIIAQETIGRRKEVDDVIANLFKEKKRKRLTINLIEGEAGIGKTALVDTVVNKLICNNLQYVSLSNTIKDLKIKKADKIQIENEKQKLKKMKETTGHDKMGFYQASCDISSNNKPFYLWGILLTKLIEDLYRKIESSSHRNLQFTEFIMSPTSEYYLQLLAIFIDYLNNISSIRASMGNKNKNLSEENSKQEKEIEDIMKDLYLLNAMLPKFTPSDEQSVFQWDESKKPLSSGEKISKIIKIISKLLEIKSQQGSLMIIIEDCQWIDEKSLLILTCLRPSTLKKVSILLTTRPIHLSENHELIQPLFNFLQNSTAFNKKMILSGIDESHMLKFAKSVLLSFGINIGEFSPELIDFIRSVHGNPKNCYELLNMLRNQDYFNDSSLHQSGLQTSLTRLLGSSSRNLASLYSSAPLHGIPSPFSPFSPFSYFLFRSSFFTRFPSIPFYGRKCTIRILMKH